MEAAVHPKGKTMHSLAFLLQADAQRVQRVISGPEQRSQGVASSAWLASLNLHLVMMFCDMSSLADPRQRRLIGCPGHDNAAGDGRLARWTRWRLLAARRVGVLRWSVDRRIGAEGRAFVLAGPPACTAGESFAAIWLADQARGSGTWLLPWADSLSHLPFKGPSAQPCLGTVRFDRPVRRQGLDTQLLSGPMQEVHHQRITG